MTPQPGLVRCKFCNQLVRLKEEGHYSIHFPTLANYTPCLGSWPQKKTSK